MIKNAATKPTKSETGPQIPYGAADQHRVGLYLGRSDAALRFQADMYPDAWRDTWETKLERMKLDPTIAMLRQLFIAPIVSTGWTVFATDEAPEGAEEWAIEEMEQIRLQLLRQAGLGCVDWGWAPFEKVYQVRADGLIGVKKLKQLLQSLTIIETDEKTGAYRGLSQEDVFLPPEKSLLFNFDVEGTDWTGRAMMRAAEKPFDATHLVNSSRQKTNARIAASHWVIYYPQGTTLIEGVKTDNFEVAESVMDRLLAEGSAILPNEIRSELEILNDRSGSSEYQAWRVELLSNGSGASAEFYTQQLRYEDTLKARAFGFPERAVLEGQFGTKAEAGDHGDMAIMGLELRSTELTQTVSKYLLQDMVEHNWGPEARETVYLVANPLVDEKRQLFLKLYELFLKNPQILLEEYDRLNREEVRSHIGVPFLDDGDEGNIDDSDQVEETTEEPNNQETEENNNDE